MTEENEEVYVRGQRSMWSRLLNQCLRELGYENSGIAGLVAEREEAVAVLRGLCEDFGDNDWEPSLHLADIINSHLAKDLYDSEDNS